MVLKMSLLRDHSISRRDTRDSLSAAIFCFPGMCTGLSHTLLFIHQDQICTTSVSFGIEWQVPIFFMEHTAVVLSICSFTCFPFIAEENDFKAKKAASISK